MRTYIGRTTSVRRGHEWLSRAACSDGLRRPGNCCFCHDGSAKLAGHPIKKHWRSTAADRLFNPQTVKENTVSKSASTSSVYRVTELIGTSESSWEDAAKHAVETATKTLRDLRVAEVNKLDLVIVDGKVTAFRARVNLSFKYEDED